MPPAFAGSCGQSRTERLLSLANGYARLEIEKDQPFVEVTESIRSLLQVCRLNQLPAALVVSRQGGFDLRSSVRVALKFVASRPLGLPPVRLAIVGLLADDGVLGALEKTADEAGIAAKTFSEEAAALAWLRPA